MFRVSGLDAKPFTHLYGLDDDVLAWEGAIRMTADARPGFPCRVTLEDAEPGEKVLLLNYEHQSANTPFRSRHAIFVREGATGRVETDHLPEQLASRLLSLRAFDAAGMMTDADVVEGREAPPVIERLLAASGTAYLHVHYARRGCYAARIDRL
ncbi:DUF1203 domain-containing protein [Sphingomonas gilva]|uniref:DUF1203 domain-containing protein n=1 Tax=Sphingomonas gilva TaxID=2305907 RepID=A0A396RJR2_9SPHN|nr:DUF1203 domain-containing protein [Sphingomonas gilva]RHW16418.1 DUF1203 domain-containing protein [Sphingomonas gilva]